VLFLGFTLSCRPPPLDFGPTGKLDRPEDVLARVKAADQALTSIQATGRMHLNAPTGKGSASVFVSAFKPASVYLEVQDFFGRPQATLVSDGQSIGAYQAQEGVYYRGPASPANVSRLLPIQLSATQMVGLLLGQVELPSDPVVRMEIDEQVGYRLEFGGGHDEGGRKTVWIHPSLFRVRQMEVSPGTIATLDGFETKEGIPYPRQVQLKSQSADTQVNLSYKSSELQLNALSDASMFDLSPPEGVPIIELDEWGARR
jgi:outer membrane lipoprotein-sorting protein